jgi:hypothetical protein
MLDPHDDPAGGAGDTPMTRTYVGVIVVEVVIIALLWILGRMYQ